MNQGADPRRRRRSGNPAVRAGAAEPRPAAGPARQRLERRSARWLLLLNTLPRWTVLVAITVLTIAGLLLPGVAGAAVLLVLAALLAWLMAISWPAVAWGGRVARLVAVALVVGAAGYKLAHP